MPQSKTRAEKLVALQEFCNLETGELKIAAFKEEEVLLDKGRQMKVLAGKIRQCKACPGLNVTRMTESAAGWGNLNADVFFVGQSLHQPGMTSGIPFIGGSGLAIIAALRLSGLRRRDCYWTNTIHCHPENNRGSETEEKENCLPFLKAELKIVQPKLVVLMGEDAKAANLKLDQIVPEAIERCIRHPAAFCYAAPERRVGWVIKLSLEIDKCLNKN